MREGKGQKRKEEAEEYKVTECVKEDEMEVEEDEERERASPQATVEIDTDSREVFPHPLTVAYRRQKRQHVLLAVLKQLVPVVMFTHDNAH
ncbi:hypothetical protein PoB_006741200 [Plakobranchus ocellatus]|uniref:Uncharacterized protein n=1 Tax=Plakobranchus ocellatus TaxID=259542 RepID=A0AAV4D9H9_9GAST|nr:hypothetical protein PoB_006741200 [Plakobranchus ocellatus]